VLLFVPEALALSEQTKTENRTNSFFMAGFFGDEQALPGQGKT
jgi:hypothetical protein